MQPSPLRLPRRLSMGWGLLVIGLVFIPGCSAPVMMDEDEGFRWPPPEPSATMVLPRSLFGTPDAAPSLAETAGRLEAALTAAGYFESRYYEIPGGFAVVTRLERINPDGTPRTGDDRWNIGARRNAALRDLLIGMFRGNPGRYRIIAFVFSDQTWEFEREEVTLADATRWFTGGSLWLPASTGERLLTTGHVATALIYEFQQTTIDETASFLIPSQIQGRTHLERAMILSALEP